MRAFISIELSEKAKKEVERVSKLIYDSDIIRGKFVEPENLHLTSKFLGELSEIEVDKVKKALGKLNFKKFKVRLKGAGFFSPSFVRVLWIGLEGEQLEKLQIEIDNILADIFPREKRMSSHVTVARVKKIRDKPSFIDFFNNLKVNEIEFEVSEVKFRKSTLTEKGPFYEDILKIKLK
ncbi:MAG: RNA 2',3'-cyclic phosphodiesterase [archaeon]